MASIDWQKATTQKARAMVNHNGKKERVEKNHSNTDINKSKSHLNIYIGGKDYDEMYNKLKARIKEVDEKYPPKRNLGAKRITCIMLETPVPQEIEKQGRAEEFLQEAHKIIENFFGKENVCGSVCHFDEQHKYIDSKTNEEKESLIHAHTLCCAYVEWTEKKKNKETNEVTIVERKGINGKHCETKQRLHELNDKMHNMCLEKFKVAFNTNETPQRKSVERLKNESKLKEETKQLQEEHKAIQDNVMQYAPPQKVFMESNKSYEERTKTYQELQAVKDLTARQQQLQVELTAREQALNQNEIAYQKKMKALNEELQQSYEKGYSVGYNSGKLRGQSEQQKKDNQIIDSLNKKVVTLSKQLQEVQEREERLENFCGSIEYENGFTVLDDFKKQEQEEEFLDINDMFEY